MTYFQTNTKYLKAERLKYAYIAKHCPYILSGQEAIEYHSFVIDDEMLKQGRPYYNVHESVFEVLCKDTSLELSMNDWRVPFNAFEIRLPKTDTPLISDCVGSSFGVCTIQVCHNYHNRFLKTMNIDGKMLSVTNIYLREHMPSMFKNISSMVDNSLILKINLSDFHKTQNADNAYYMLFAFIDSPSMTLKMLFDEGYTKYLAFHQDDQFQNRKTIFPKSSLEKCVRLTLAVSLLATASQKVLEYDVLSKHIEAYQQMRANNNLERMKVLEEKARDKGKYGWNIGESAARILPKLGGFSAKGTGQGTKHHKSSVRGAHNHIYRVGKGRTKTKVKWVEQTIVRPDLLPLNNS